MGGGRTRFTRQRPQVRTVTATGPQVHYAQQGDPDGETILFLPAYADSSFSYSRILPLLPARFHAFALDQRGHGDSERPGCCYTVDDLAADTVAFLDDAGIERATLVGHAGSCFTARQVAVTHPERIAGLVLIGAPLSLAKPAVVAFQATVHALEDPVPAEFAREFQTGAIGDLAAMHVQSAYDPHGDLLALPPTADALSGAS